MTNEKELENIRRQKHVDNLKRERDGASEQFELVTKKKDLFLKKRDLVLKNRKIMLDKFKIIKPDWEYQTDQEYLDNLKEFNVLLFEEQDLGDKERIDLMDRNIAAAIEQRDHATKELARIEKEMNEE